MRLGSVLSEALRNIGAGVSHALLMFAAVLFASTLLGGYEAVNVVGARNRGGTTRQRLC